MLIRNYGLFWRRDCVFWGRPNVLGHLKGHKIKSQKTAVDFREQRGVYCLYDANYRLVYVGQAGRSDNQRLFGRLNRHRKDAISSRWELFSWFGIDAVDEEKGTLHNEKLTAKVGTGHVLDHIEAVLIAAAEPVLNKQGGKFGQDAVQYVQIKDRKNIGPDMQDMIREVWEEIL